MRTALLFNWKKGNAQLPRERKPRVTTEDTVRMTDEYV